jgi:hemerythrin-like domain-containing protein
MSGKSEADLPQGQERLDQRAGLPGDLVWLYERYPREIWRGHANLRGIAEFWLKRHDMFREVGAMLAIGITQFRENDQPPAEFARWLAPRIRFFLGELEGHHTVEDHHYFPVFKQAEARLARGFDLLDSDHHVIHAALERNADVANRFFGQLASAQEARKAAERYADENERLVALLHRHLEDEEDLIVPMILDRGEVLFE